MDKPIPEEALNHLEGALSASASTPAPELLARAAILRGFLKAAQVEEALAEQRRQAAAGRPETLEAVFVRRGLLNAEQLALLRDEREVSGPPPVLDRYELGRKLGEGATAVVYAARDRTLNRDVAVKLVRRAVGLREDARARFEREARAAAAVIHPNVVKVHDLGIEDGRLFIVLELVEGMTLAQRLRQGPMEVDEAVHLVERAARGVAAAHEKGIVHRDLKPANILLPADGIPKVGDFGLAQLGAEATALTKTGAVLGTPRYMAPEQFEGRTREITPRTDVYALGAILHECVTGGLSHSASRADMPRALGAICAAAMDRNPLRRHGTAGEFADDLERFRTGGSVRGDRRRIGRIAALVMAGALAVALGVILRGSPDAHEIRSELEAGQHLLRTLQMRMTDPDHSCREDGMLAAEGEARFRRALEIAPGHAEALLGLGRALLLQGRDDEALIAFGQANEAAPALAAPLLERARVLLLRYGQLRQAGGELRAETAESLALRAQIEADLRRSDSLMSGSAEQEYAAGLLAVAEGRFDRAERLLTGYTRISPRDASAHYWHCYCLFQLGRHAESELAATRAIESWRCYVAAYQRRGLARAAQKNLAGAVADYRKALSMRADASTLVNLGNVELKRGEADAARRCYSEALRLDGRNVLAQVGLGASWIHEGYAGRETWERAVAALTRAIELDPAYANAWSLRGTARRALGDGADALEDHAEAIRLAPEDPTVHFNRGNARSAAGDLDGALADYGEAVRRNPRYTEALVNGGKAWFLKGDRARSAGRPDAARESYRRAEGEFTKALQIDATLHQAYFNRGGARQVLGEPAAALADMEAALACAPSDWPKRADAERFAVELRRQLQAPR